MKKIILSLLLIFSMLILSSCFDDYPKDLRFLSEKDFPEEVTRTFKLYKGRLTTITYTSSNSDVLEITEDNYAKVTQTNEDTIVTIEARIRKYFKTFDVKILKTGSDLTVLEKFEDFSEEINHIFPKIVNDITKLPSSYDIFTFTYTKVKTDNYFTIEEVDDNLFLVPFIDRYAHSSSVIINVYVNDVRYSTIPLSIKYLYDENITIIHNEIFKSLNIENINYFKYNHGRANIVMGLNDTIDLNNITSSYSNDFTYEINDPIKENSFLKLENNIITRLNEESNWSHSLILTITYNNIPMNFLLIIDNIRS